MDNLVGDKVPSAEKFKALAKKLVEIRQELAKFCIVLPADARKRRLRMRKNAHQYVPLLQNLVAKYKIETAAASISGMNHDAQLAEGLDSLEDEANGIDTLISDTLQEAEHEVWQAFLFYYGILQHMAERMPELAAELKPIKDFMAQSRRERKPADPSES